MAVRPGRSRRSQTDSSCSDIIPSAACGEIKSSYLVNSVTPFRNQAELRYRDMAVLWKPLAALSPPPTCSPRPAPPVAPPNQQRWGAPTSGEGGGPGGGGGGWTRHSHCARTLTGVHSGCLRGHLPWKLHGSSPSSQCYKRGADTDNSTENLHNLNKIADGSSSYTQSNLGSFVKRELSWLQFEITSQVEICIKIE